jgi:hypothetical protein
MPASKGERTQPQVHFWGVIRAALTGATAARFRSQRRSGGNIPGAASLSLAVGGQTGSILRAGGQ